jgi:hypothetical protein
MAELGTTGLSSDANLQGYWRFENNFNDSGPNGYNLTATNSPTSNTAGKYGNGGDFEQSTSQYATIADASCANLEISGSQTWGCWVKLENLVTGDNQIMMGKKNATPVAEIEIYKSALVGGTLRFYGDGWSTPEVNSTVVPVVDTWYHVVGRRDNTANTLAIFVNNVKTELTSITGTHTDTNGAFSIGRNGAQNAGYTDGMIDDAFVFNRALTDAEIAILFNEGVALRGFMTTNTKFWG